MDGRTRLAAWALCIAVAGTSLCGFAGSSGLKNPPRFAATTITGETFTTESARGKVVLLQFWTTWCALCRRDQSVVDRIDREFRGQGLVVLAVNVGESKKRVTRYLAANPRTCRVVLTDDTNLPAIYSATAYPMYIVIGRDGNIAASQRGAVGDGGLRELLRRAGMQAEDTTGDER